MGEGARKTEQLHDKEVLAEAEHLVSAYADKARMRLKRTSQQPSKLEKRLSMTRFPERLEAASHRGLSLSLLLVLGFAVGVTIMIIILA